MAGVVEHLVDAGVKTVTFAAVKAVVTILLSLVLLLAQALGASAVDRPASCVAADCCSGDKWCCAPASDAPQPPGAPLPTSGNYRVSLIAALPVLIASQLPVPKQSSLTPIVTIPPPAAAVPLYVRNCSYLI